MFIIFKVLAATVQPSDTDAEQLKRLFANARKRALDDVNEHLADFRQKRQIGKFLSGCLQRFSNKKKTSDKDYRKKS